MERNLDQALTEFPPDFVVYNAGTDILEGDSLGLLSISEQVTSLQSIAIDTPTAAVALSSV